MSNLGDRDWSGPKNLDGSNFWASQPSNIILNAVVPELLEALQRSTALLEWESKWLGGNNMADHERAIVIQLAKAAITKATGEQR